MKLIVCIDDKNGMAFNHRRQSRDRVLIEDLIQTLDGEPLALTPDSAKLFEGKEARLLPLDSPTEADRDGYCFLETTDPAPYEERIDEVILYRWNRHYPADVYFTLDLTAFSLCSTEEFVGSSHETITKEVWKK